MVCRLVPALVLACLLLLLRPCYASADADEPDMSNVAVLTHHNFSATNEGKWFVLFYAPWCHHCRALKPLFAALAVAPAANRVPSPTPELSGDPTAKTLRLGMVDCTVWTQLCDFHHVSAYPGLRYGVRGQWFDYEGAPLTPALEHFAQRFMNPDLNLPQAPPDVLQREHQTNVALLVVEDAKQVAEMAPVLIQAVMGTASLLRLRFGYLHSPELLQKLRDSPEDTTSWKLVVQTDVHRVAYNGDWNAADIIEWLKPYRFLVVEDLNWQTFYPLGHQGKKMAILLTNPKQPKDFKAHVAALRAAAHDPALREKFAFGYMDAPTWGKWLGTMNLGHVQLPYLFAFDAKYELHYRNDEFSHHIRHALDSSGGNTAGYIAGFLRRVADNQETPQSSGLGFSILWMLFDTATLPVKVGVVATTAVIVVLFLWALLRILCCGPERDPEPLCQKGVKGD